MSLQTSTPKTNRGAQAASGRTFVWTSFAAIADAKVPVARLACGIHTEPGMRLDGVRKNDKL